MSGSAPLVSVVVAAYNAADFIEETCRSVLSQTYSNFELLVVDDGSTDRTANIVLALSRGDGRVRLLQQTNRGVAAARNAGIAASTGDFLAVLDADDLWDPTKIERQVERLQQAGPTVGLVYCWWAWIDTQSRVLDRSPEWRVEGRVLDKLVEINFTGNTSVPMFRRSCVTEVGGYDPSLRDRGCQGSEDWDLAVRIAEHYSVVVVPAVLVGYRRRADGMSTACTTMWRSRGEVMKAVTHRNPHLGRSVVRRSDAQYALYLAGVSFWAGRYLDSCRWVLRSKSLSLILQVAPYIVRTVVARLLVRGTKPVVLVDARMHDLPSLPDPMMPYDRIYARLWQRHQSA